MDRQHQKTKSKLRKEEADKHRENRDAIQQKRLHVLWNPKKLAFRGWKDVSEPWTFVDCCEYIKWCHIGKVFSEDCHNKHWKFSKANLKYCLDNEFKQRCIEVYQVLDNHGTVHRNEANDMSNGMGWTKVGEGGGLEGSKSCFQHPHPNRTRYSQGVLKFLGGELSIRRTQVEKLDPYVWSDSSLDSNSDGSQPLKLSNNPATVASRRLRMRKRACDDEQLPPLHPTNLHMVPHILGMKNMAGVGNIIGASNIAGASNTMGRSDNASIGGMLLALALQGTSNIAGARASASAGNNPGASRSAIAN